MASSCAITTAATSSTRDSALRAAAGQRSAAQRCAALGALSILGRARAAAGSATPSGASPATR
eukprot:706870-Pyramimonas_sp.AAC.1